MKAVVYEKYGPPEVLQLKEVQEPVPNDDEILVRVHATTVTAADWRLRKPDPQIARLFNGLFHPRKVTVLGFEFSGEIESVGARVKKFKPGDQVFGNAGMKFGAYAEYLCLSEKGMIVKKPHSLTFEQAAAISFGGLAALNILRKANIQPGQRVLINGALGSAGTYAVQLAKYWDASVTAVCSSANFDLAISLGADRVIDYHENDITEMDTRYDVIFDAVGRMISGLSKRKCLGALDPHGVYLSVEMEREDQVKDLEFLAGLIKDGAIKPVIDRLYPLDQIVEAHRYVEKLHKKGNVIITI